MRALAGTDPLGINDSAWWASDGAAALLGGLLAGVVTGLALWLTIRNERRSARLAAAKPAAGKALVALDELVAVFDDPRPGYAAISAPLEETPDLRAAFFAKRRESLAELTLLESLVRQDWRHFADVVETNGRGLRDVVSPGAADVLAHRSSVVSLAANLQNWIRGWLVDPRRPGAAAPSGRRRAVTSSSP